jgi:hypothetical protein
VLPDRRLEERRYIICTCGAFLLLAPGEEPTACPGCGEADGGRVRTYIKPEFGFVTTTKRPKRATTRRPSRQYASRLAFAGYLGTEPPKFIERYPGIRLGAPWCRWGERTRRRRTPVIAARTDRASPTLSSIASSRYSAFEKACVATAGTEFFSSAGAQPQSSPSPAAVAAAPTSATVPPLLRAIASATTSPGNPPCRDAFSKALTLGWPVAKRPASDSYTPELGSHVRVGRL